MDAFLLDLYMQLPWPAKLALLIVFPLVSAASAYTSGTNTPPPNTFAGKVYRLIEAVALLGGKAKQVGVPVPSLPTLESAALAEFAASQKEGRPYSMESVMKSLTSTAAALLLLAMSFSLSGCANSGPGGVLTTSSLTSAQTAAGNILQVIKAEAAIYTQQPGISTSQASTINLAVSSLSAAVSSFQSVSSFGNVDQLATAVLTTATAVVNQLPNISATDKAAIDGGIVLLEALLPVVLPAAPAAPPEVIASGPL